MSSGVRAGGAGGARGRRAVLRAETSPGGSEQESIQAAGHRKGGGEGSDLESEEEEERLDAVEAAVHEVAQEEVALPRRRPADLEQL